VPDHKTRLGAVALDLAYSEGKPIERQIQVKADFEDLPTILARIRASPASLRELSDVPEIHVMPND
jgi:hypothetical protein